MDDFQKWRAAMIDKIGAYWDAAYREGKTGACESDTANALLYDIEEMMQAHQAALTELRLYRALCEGYTLEELQRMSLTFKAQIDVLRAMPRWPQWRDPNDKTQSQYLPWIGEPVLFCHAGTTYYGRHTGGAFETGQGATARRFDTWECRWMYPPAAQEPQK